MYIYEEQTIIIIIIRRKTKQIGLGT